MIEEAYVSFETAKLLKEKGFDEFCHAYYEDEDNPNINIHGSKAINWNKTEFISKPTQQMTMRWLREVHNKYCDVSYDIDYKWYFQIIDLKEIVEYYYPETKHYHDETDFNTYEEAVEAAIKYCLKNLI